MRAWKRAGPGSLRPAMRCHPRTPMRQSSITASATTLRWSAWSTMSTSKFWNAVGPLRPTLAVR